MLEVALTFSVVVSALSGIAVAFIFARAQAKLLDHLRDVQQIGGTPVSIAAKQTDFEMARIADNAKQQNNIVAELRQMRDEQLDKGPLS